MKNTVTARIIATVEKQMIDNGTMARMDAKHAQYNAYAQSLGYDNSQQAYNALGKPFLAKASTYQVVTPAVAKAVQGFISLVGLGWKTELAFECSFDGVFDMLDKEEFLNLCQTAVKEKASATNN